MLKSRVWGVALAVVLLPFTMAADCGGGGNNAPKEGVITQITPDSVSCGDRVPNTVAVLYQPDGKDQDGKAWPVSLVCVTPDAARGLVVGGRVQA